MPQSDKPECRVPTAAAPRHTQTCGFKHLHHRIKTLRAARHVDHQRQRQARRLQACLHLAGDLDELFVFAHDGAGKTQHRALPRRAGGQAPRRQQRHRGGDLAGGHGQVEARLAGVESADQMRGVEFPIRAHLLHRGRLADDAERASPRELLQQVLSAGWVMAQVGAQTGASATAPRHEAGSSGS